MRALSLALAAVAAGLVMAWFITLVIPGKFVIDQRGVFWVNRVRDRMFRASTVSMIARPGNSAPHQ